MRHCRLQPRPSPCHSGDTADLLPFCTADALSGPMLFQVTVSVLAKCQGSESHLFASPLQPVQAAWELLYPGGSFNEA